MPKDLAIFPPLRGRPNMVLSRRLPETTARYVLSIRFARGLFIRVTYQQTEHAFETFPGAACLRRFAVIHASWQIARGLLLRAKAAPLQATRNDQFSLTAIPWRLKIWSRYRSDGTSTTTPMQCCRKHGGKHCFDRVREKRHALRQLRIQRPRKHPAPCGCFRVTTPDSTSQRSD